MSMTARHWIGGFFLLLLLLGLCSWAIGWRTERMISSAYESCGPSDTIRLDDLKLTPEQKRKVLSLQAAYRKTIVGMCGRHCDEKFKLAKLLAASPRDDKAIRTASEDVARIQADCELLTTEHVLSMAGAMDEKQAEIFLRKFSGEIVKTCPIHFAPETR
jgi:hypothetical protein